MRVLVLRSTFGSMFPAPFSMYPCRVSSIKYHLPIKTKIYPRVAVRVVAGKPKNLAPPCYIFRWEIKIFAKVDIIAMVIKIQNGYLSDQPHCAIQILDPNIALIVRSVGRSQRTNTNILRPRWIMTKSIPLKHLFLSSEF